LAGWPLRALGAGVLLVALSGPVLRQEQRTPLSDIVLTVVDESPSQGLAGRAAQVETALAHLRGEVAALPDTELRVVRSGAGEDGTLLMGALSAARAEIPGGRLAGVIVLTDGQVHDAGPLSELPAPLHVLLTGRPEDWDRRLIVRNAPPFAIPGEEIALVLRIEDTGAVPGGLARADLRISADGGEEKVVSVPVGRDIPVPVRLGHAGQNIIRFALPEMPGELTGRNNAAVVQINGVRDRLRVLLVSGVPHPGERTWRNLLKSDSAVDLVHFTILRPPEKQDGVPVTELSLIAFPTRELFMEKIDEFDLIIFDRYRRRGILPESYLENVSRYVEEGGAVLVSAGPDYAGAESIYRSPLASVLPAIPTARVRQEGFRPGVTDLGQRHPVTSGLKQGQWGRWFRLVEVDADRGQVVMTGPDAQPLLVLDRVGAGRVALLASDHAWLWDRGFEGGGPQMELLRRLAHWMMKEPDLEEEALSARADGTGLQIIRRSLSRAVGAVEVIRPDGESQSLPLEETAPGVFEVRLDTTEPGIYRLREGDLEAAAALGPAAPREFAEVVASGAALEPVVKATRGAVWRISGGMPDLRQVRSGRSAVGRGWIGVTPRDAMQVQDVRLVPLAPAWAMLLLAAGLILGGWLREGRR
ncbi:glutamine amidotransferase, partial [Rhodovulum imhoffii]